MSPCNLQNYQTYDIKESYLSSELGDAQNYQADSLLCLHNFLGNIHVIPYSELLHLGSFKLKLTEAPENRYSLTFTMSL